MHAQRPGTGGVFIGRGLQARHDRAGTVTIAATGVAGNKLPATELRLPGGDSQVLDDGKLPLLQAAARLRSLKTKLRGADLRGGGVTGQCLCLQHRARQHPPLCNGAHCIGIEAVAFAVLDQVALPVVLAELDDGDELPVGGHHGPVVGIQGVAELNTGLVGDVAGAGLIRGEVAVTVLQVAAVVGSAALALRRQLGKPATSSLPAQRGADAALLAGFGVEGAVWR